MKGVVFTEFLDLVDDTFGEDTTDTIVSACPLKSGGVYTGVGTYDASELHLLVGALSGETGMTPEELQRVYGKRLFERFGDLYPDIVGNYHDPFTMLENVDEAIHDNVRALYPDAELPVLDAKRVDDQTLHFTYQSPRNIPAFCRGLIEGCVEHFGAKAVITEEEVQGETLPTYRFTVVLCRS